MMHPVFADLLAPYFPSFAPRPTECGCCSEPLELEMEFDAETCCDCQRSEESDR